MKTEDAEQWVQRVGNFESGEILLFFLLSSLPSPLPAPARNVCFTIPHNALKIELYDIKTAFARPGGWDRGSRMKDARKVQKLQTQPELKTRLTVVIEGHCLGGHRYTEGRKKNIIF